MVNNASNAATASRRQAVEARAKAIRLCPELENYHWHDTYFENDGRYDIIAVFDHDTSSLKCIKFLYFYAGSTVLVVSTGIVGVFASQVSTILLGFVLAISTILFLAMCRCCFFGNSSMPHTAVTTSGVIHQTGNGFDIGSGECYLFPFQDILSVEIAEERTENGVARFLRMRLVNSLSSYQVGSVGRSNNATTFTFVALINKAFFVSLVMALKRDVGRTDPVRFFADGLSPRRITGMSTCNERSSVAVGADSIESIQVSSSPSLSEMPEQFDEEAQALHASIQEQIKRQHDLLRARQNSGAEFTDEAHGLSDLSRAEVPERFDQDAHELRTSIQEQLKRRTDLSRDRQKRWQT